uniref:Uncharacterized protein n=1 Tax=Ditylenchus dipsaci TaxID=166011 RepID=A0A915E172_9BILA
MIVMKHFSIQATAREHHHPAAASEGSTLAVDGPSNYCYPAAYSSTSQQPRALEEQDIASEFTRHTPQANTLPTDMGVE